MSVAPLDPLTSLHFCMGEAQALNGAQERPSPASPTPPQQPPEPAALAVDTVCTARDAGENDATDEALEKQPDQGADTQEIASAAQAQAAEEPTHRTNPSSPPETPDHVQADEGEAATDVDTEAKSDGCATPPPPAHYSEGSDTHSADGHGTSPAGDEEPRPAGATRGSNPKRDAAASKSRLLAFRSFTRDKKVEKSGDVAPPEPVPRVPSPGEPRPARGRAAGEDGADHKENGKDWRKRFWK